MSDQQIIWIAIGISIILVIVAFALTPLKIKVRKNATSRIEKCLSIENKKLITSHEDLRTLEIYLDKFESYSNKWYYNNTPTFLYRSSKVKKIIKKYNLSI